MVTPLGKLEDKKSNCQSHLTFDVDWAPDDSIDIIRQILNPLGIKATFFITHNSEILSDLINDGHEIGIHPNFLDGSTHGESPQEVIEFLLNIVPQARAIRMHALLQSSPLLHFIFSKFPQLKYDFSIFMYNFPLIRLFEWQSEGVKFKRLNYNWEDDTTFYQENFDWNSPHFPADLNIYDFHPIHVHLNSKDNLLYNSLKKSIDFPLSKLSASKIVEYINPGYGAQTFLNSLVTSEADFIDFERLICVSEY